MAYRSSEGIVAPNSTPVSQLTVNKSAGVVDGDILILAAGDFDQGDLQPPSGWTIFADNLGVSRYRAWWRVASSEPSSYTVTGYGNVVGYAAKLLFGAWSGRSSSQSMAETVTIDETPDSTPVAIDAGGVTAATGDDIAVLVIGGQGNNSGLASITANPTNYTPNTIARADYDWAFLWYRDNVSSGATGTLAGTVTLGSFDQGTWASIVVALSSAGVDTPLAVTKADIQPAGQAVSFANSMALTPASFSIGGSVVALQWQQAGWVISVDASSITIAPQLLDGRRGVPVGTALPTIIGSAIQFQLSSGIWSVNLDTGLPTILGQSVNLEKNQFFSTGALTFSPSTIVLSENAVVVSASPSIAGQDITLTWSQGSAGVISAAFSIQGQAIALERTWSLVVDPAALSFTGQNVLFDWVVTNTVIVGTAQFSAVGSNLILGRNIPVTSTAISPIGQSIGRDDGILVFPSPISISGQEIDLSFPFTLGLFLEKANPYFTGSDVVMFLGDGQPRVSKHAFFSDHIQLQQKPQIVTDKHKQVGSASH